MVMSDANYLAPAGVAFAIPVHPGPPPPPVGAAAVIAIATLLYTEAIADVTLYNNLSAALTAQILTAVNSSFLSALEDPTFGFSDVTPRTMLLNHLRTEYGTLTPGKLETNCSALSEPWNFDTPIESKISGQKSQTSNALPRSVTSPLPISPPSHSPWK
jgi:hypothetical protein